MEMRKLIAVALTILVLGNCLCSCKSDKKENKTEHLNTTPSSSYNETIDSEENSKEPESNIDSDIDTSYTTYVEKEEKSDGSIFVKITDRDGKVLQTVEYSVTTGNTIKYAYEYNERGMLVMEYDYEGPGNLVDEFVNGNHSNATMSGQNVHNNIGGYDVDLGAAFEATITELAPLYKRAENIWDKYGVAVLIADKVSSYTSTAELCYDYTKINDCIDLIEKCLECYPEGFFREFSGEWINTTVCIQLVGTGGPAGVFFDGDEYKIVQIDTNDYCPEENTDDDGGFFCYTLHHEICHMISYTLLDRADKSVLPLTEEKWNSYNPDGFNYVGYYDDEKESELFTSNDNSEYFIYSYACSTPEEDRAITFGKAMSYYQGFEEIGFNENIEAKLIYLSDCIKNGFMGVEWSEKPAWEFILDHEDYY